MLVLYFAGPGPPCPDLGSRCFSCRLIPRIFKVIAETHVHAYLNIHTYIYIYIYTIYYIIMQCSQIWVTIIGVTWRDYVCRFSSEPPGTPRPKSIIGYLQSLKARLHLDTCSDVISFHLAGKNSNFFQNYEVSSKKGIYDNLS